jgi:hypothetical protein
MAEESQRLRRIVVALLGLAMCASVVWLMVEGRNTTFSGDDIYYYAHYIVHGFATEVGHGVKYYFAPHNGHLQVGGKVIYQVLFELFGAKYWIFRAVNTFGLLLAVGLFFVLAARRVGSLAALAPSVLLLFFGFAWEPLIWPFDMHTVFALVFGLGAVLAIEREDRLGDVLACVLLVLAISMIELGLAFLVGIAVSVLIRSDRWRRCWIFLVPAVLYAIWWVWARQFHQSAITLLNVHLIGRDVVESLGAIAGAVTGINPTGPEAPAVTIGVTAAGMVLAAVAIVALALYLARRRSVSPTFWVFAATAVAYWITIALGGRPPDSSRYVLGGTVLVLLAFADGLRGARWSLAAIVALFVVVALSIPANVAKYYDGRRLQLNDAQTTKVEVAMLNLARQTVEPGYTPAVDPPVIEKGGGLYAPLPAAEYFRAGDEHGTLGESLDAVRAEPLQFREIADATLAQADRLALQPATKPGSTSDCSVASTEPTYFRMPKGGMLLGSKSGEPVEVVVARFALDGAGFRIGQLEPGTWSSLQAPADADPEPWRVLVKGPAYVCPK